MSADDKIILREMEWASRSLAGVKTADYRTAYHICLGGLHVLRPHNSAIRGEVGTAILHGRLLGLNMILENWALG